jgi:hypothetical protein
MATRGKIRNEKLTTLLIASVFLVTAGIATSMAANGEIGPVSMENEIMESGSVVGKFSERTISLGIRIHKDGAHLEGFTLLNRPFVRPLALAPSREYRLGKMVQVELILHGPAGRKYTQRIEANLLCFRHGSEAPAHVIGDTIFKHKQILMTEVPELPGFDRLEITYLDRHGHRVTAMERLVESKFIPTSSLHQYDNLAFAETE